MNRSKIATKEICQKCGRCCKSFSLIVSFDEALRFKLLNEQKIRVEEIKTNTDTIYYKVIFRYPCLKLKIDNRGIYSCGIYDNKEFPRPQMCKEYPDNMPLALLESEKKVCPALRG